MRLVASIGALYVSSCFNWRTICIKLLLLEHYTHLVASIGALYESSYFHLSTIFIKLLPLVHYIYISSSFHWSTIFIKLLPMEHYMYQVVSIEALYESSSIGVAGSLCRLQVFRCK